MAFFERLFGPQNTEIKKMKKERNVNGLIELMSSNETTRIRKKAAKALVILYKSGRLTKKQKQKILALRSAIDSSHTDFARSHWDKPATGHEDRSHGSKLDTGCSGMYHTDIDRKHEDIPGQMHQDVVKKGLGVHFPL